MTLTVRRMPFPVTMKSLLPMLILPSYQERMESMQKIRKTLLLDSPISRAVHSRSLPRVMESALLPAYRLMTEALILPPEEAVLMLLPTPHTPGAILKAEEDTRAVRAEIPKVLQVAIPAPTPRIWACRIMVHQTKAAKILPRTVPA